MDFVSLHLFWPFSYFAHIMYTLLSFVGKKWLKVWKTVPLCIFFLLIWKERNKIVFENGEFSIQRLKNSFISLP